SAPVGWPDFGVVFDELTLSNGLVLDRQSDPTTVSVAATGFVAYAAAEQAVREGGDVEAVRERVRTGFRTTVLANPVENRGWLSHFTEPHGEPKPWSEVSTIDTALFYMGMLRAAEVLRDPALAAEVHAWLSRIELEPAMRDGFFLHGFVVDPATGERRVIPHTWNDTSEGVILSRLFGKPFAPEIVRVDFPLFVYVYPLCFFDDEWYEQLLEQAVEHQLGRHGYFGVTATDGPYGYAVDDPLVVAPLLVAALADRFPQAGEVLRQFGVGPGVPAYHVATGWRATDRIAIDFASAYLISIRPRPGRPAAAFASVRD
ncbi:MAG: hypothetical protein AAGJ97_05545, partial [Planctomycetota bacterium]